MSVCVRGRALSVVLAYRPETAARTGCVQASVLLGVDSVRIGVLLGAVARVAYRSVARGGWSMQRRPGSSIDTRRRVRAHRHGRCCAVCAGLTAAIRLRAAALPIGVQLSVSVLSIWSSRPGRGTPWWRSGPAWRTASASGQRPSGLGSARGLSPPPQLPGRVALAEQVVGRCYGQAGPASDALNVYRPAPGQHRRACPASARRHPARRVARQVNRVASPERHRRRPAPARLPRPG